jgi:hypothetical protein
MKKKVKNFFGGLTGGNKAKTGKSKAGKSKKKKKSKDWFGGKSKRRKNTGKEEEKEVSVDELEEQFKDSKLNDDILDGLEGGEQIEPETDQQVEEIFEEEHKDIDSDNTEDEEDNTAEEFDGMMAAYSTQDFMKDIIKVLKFDTTEVEIKLPQIVKRGFRIHDESLQRKVHLYEHVILAANGYCRPGFLKILTQKQSISKETLKSIHRPFEVGFNKFYDTAMTFVSAYQGEIENFNKYCKGLLIALNLEGNSEFPAKEKAIKTLMLAKGAAFESLTMTSTSGNMYEEIFKKLFGKQSTKAMYLHKFATLDEEQYKNLFTVNEKIIKDAKLLESQKLSKFLIDEFLIKHLEMDTDSLEWLKSLIRISAGDLDGFEYIAKEYEISNTKMNVYKSICTKDINQMDSFFEAIDEEVPFYLCNTIAWVTNGDIDILAGLIMDQIYIERDADGLDVTWENISKLQYPPDLQADHDNFVAYLKNLIGLISGESFHIDTMRIFFTECNVDPGVSNILIGYNAILNKKFAQVRELLEYREFIIHFQLGLVDAVINLASK